jgi:hypothetical protein
MRENFPYVALRPIKQPGTLLTPYHAGDGMPASAVDDWELVVGEDVMPTNTKVIPRPEGDASRAEWEAFAIGQGWNSADAADATLTELRKIPAPDDQTAAEPLPDPTAPPARPDESAAKSEWITYVVSQGADEEWANTRSTTKADLMAYEASDTRRPADEVADAVDEQANG